MIALMMEAVHTSETSVNLNLTTRRYIPEDSKLQLEPHNWTFTHIQGVQKVTNPMDYLESVFPGRLI
jgi:hypothetical protein